jgi:hypothetical protein
MELFPLKVPTPSADGVKISPQAILPGELFTILRPTNKVSRTFPGFQALCDVLERTPVPTLCESVVEPVVLHRVYLPLERLVADTCRSRDRNLQALSYLQSLGHPIPERNVPLAGGQRLWRAIQVSVKRIEGEDLELRLCIRVGPQREEVVEIRCGYERGHVRERLQQAVRYLLMHPKVDHLLHDAYGLEGGLVPQGDGSKRTLPVKSFVSLHTLLVPAPMNRPGRALLDLVDHFLDRNRTAAGGVPAEDPVRHHFGVDEAGVGEDVTGHALAVPANGVANNFTFYHRREEEPKALDFSWFLGEMDKRIAIPREMFQKCAICGLEWGMCTHAGNNQVCVDNEAMRMLYEKIGEDAPVYPPSWADFWYAVKDIYRKR